MQSLRGFRDGETFARRLGVGAGVRASAAASKAGYVDGSRLELGEQILDQRRARAAAEINERLESLKHIEHNTDDARDLDNIAYQRSRLEQMRQSLEDERRQARFSPPSRASSAFAMSPLAATPSTSSSMRRAPSPLLPPISGTPPSARQTQRRSGGSAASPAASVSAASPSRKPFATSAALPAADRREAQSRYAAELQAQIRARETLAAREPGDMGDECRARRQREELYRRELSRSVEAGAPRAVIPTAVRVSSLDDDSSLEQRRAKAAATRAMLDSGLAARDAARAAEPPAYRRPERYDEPYKLYAL